MPCAFVTGLDGLADNKVKRFMGDSGESNVHARKNNVYRAKGRRPRQGYGTPSHSALILLSYRSLVSAKGRARNSRALGAASGTWQAMGPPHYAYVIRYLINSLEDAWRLLA